MQVYRQGRAEDLPTYYYEFSQNNSGGFYHFDANRGISRYVYVEARSASQANRLAEDIGLYFDGYGDCVECCGYRWHEKWGSEEGLTVMGMYDSIVASMSYQWARHGQEEGDPDIFVHKLDGTIVGIWFGDERDQVLLDSYTMNELEGC